MQRLIAITGGIGSGKSVVSHIVTALGYQVYDCDREARMLMDNSGDIKRAIATDIDRACLTDDGQIDRTRLSEIVFTSPTMLERLNAIVHGAVREHLAAWHNSRENLKFVETAILYQSGVDRMVDEVWDVIAPRELRIERVIRRNGLTREQVESRIDAQDSFMPESVHSLVRQIVNDGDTPLLPQVEKLLDNYSQNLV